MSRNHVTTFSGCSVCGESRLTWIGHHGLARVGVGVLVFVGDALGVVDYVLREEDDEEDLQEDEEGNVRRAPPVREVEHVDGCLLVFDPRRLGVANTIPHTISCLSLKQGFEIISGKMLQHFKA